MKVCVQVQQSKKNPIIYQKCHCWWEMQNEKKKHKKMIVPVRKTTKWWWRQELANSWFTVYYTLLWFYWQSLLEESVGKCRSLPLWSHAFELRNRVNCKPNVEGLYKTMTKNYHIFSIFPILAHQKVTSISIKEITLKCVMGSPKLWIRKMAVTIEMVLQNVNLWQDKCFESFPKTWQFLVVFSSF